MHTLPTIVLFIFNVGGVFVILHSEYTECEKTAIARVVVVKTLNWYCLV